MKYLNLPARCLILLIALSVQVVAQQRAAGDVFDGAVAPPIKLTAVPVNNRSWLNEPLVQVENISGKTIHYMVIEIMLPDATTNDPLMLAYGRPPGQSLPMVMESLQPGMKVALSVGRNACDTVKSHLLKSGIRPAAGSHLGTGINAVIFANGTAWFDGLLHVADPRDPRRWNVVENVNLLGSSGASPLFSFMQATFRPKPTTELCWKRLGTETIDCCPGLQIASAIMVQVFGGVFEPFPMTHFCGDGSSCEWIKQVACSHPPPDEAD